MSLCSTNGILSDTVLILAAGGSSSRFKRGNKLLQDLNGLPIFLHAVRTAAPLLGKRNIFMAVPRSEEDVFRMIQKQYLPDVEVVFVQGGASRTESVLHALEAAVEQSDAEYAAVQDAARPFLTGGLLRRCVEACREFGGAVACHKICDTVKRASPEDGCVEVTVARDQLWAAETPQVFRLKELRDACRAALASGETFTDDAQVMECFSSARIRIVENRDSNEKITFYEDLLRAREM